MISQELLRSFFAHVNELRSRFLKSLGVFCIAAFVCFSYADQALKWLIKPAGHLVFTTPGGAFSAVMAMTMVMAVIVSAPFLLYQVWAFIAGALKPNEKQFVYIFGPLSFVFFCMGVAFAFFVAIPLAYKFLMSFSSDELRPMISVDNYMSFVGNLIVVFGVTFELPLILAFLAKLGIATPEFLRQKRRHAVILILIVAAILTPPDIASQLLLALPLVVLYELGIIFAKIFGKKY